MIFAGLNLVQNSYFREVGITGNERLELYESTLEAAIKRHDYLPFLVSEDIDVKALLKGSNKSVKVSIKLQSWQESSQANTLYLMNKNGEVLASSNWQSKKSFVGNNYNFRPYFTKAMNGEIGRFFAIGFTTGIPGLFLSHPVKDAGLIIGVAVVKIDMAPLETDWASGGEHVMITDKDGVVFLASNPAWKYKSMKGLDENVLDRIKSEKKYSGKRIEKLNLTVISQSPNQMPIAKFDASVGMNSKNRRFREYLIHSQEVPQLGWRLLYLSDLSSLKTREREVLLFATLSTVLLVLAGFIIIIRRRGRRELERRVASRTRELNTANLLLSNEVQERKRTEENLRMTQEELIQAAKMAALGQMSAGIVHEINQPMSAMQTFLASTKLFLQQGDIKTVEENLNDIAKLMRRMNSIVSHLKSFASKSKGQLSRVELGQVIANALLILGSRINLEKVELDWKLPPEQIYVYGDEIKLEQIMVNLVRNALDAMLTTNEDKHLGISLKAEGLKVSVQISDTGPGISSDDLPRVFDPFFTTKDLGDGMGLGLSVSYGIAREFNGDLVAENKEQGGALFRLTLVIAPAAEAEEKITE